MIYDYQTSQKVALKPFMVEMFQETWGLQEKVRARNEARVRELLRRVEVLESGSWRREGAVEDRGTGG